MIKRIICALLCVIFAFFLIGCGTKLDSVKPEPTPTPLSQFVKVEGNNLSMFLVVYHRDTKVMYAVSNGTYNSGNFTLLVNPDGSPMLWEGD